MMSNLAMNLLVLAYLAAMAALAVFVSELGI